MKAAAIAQMVGSAITNIAVSSDGTLAIETSDKTKLSVCGVSHSPEHSWSLERRDDEFHLTALICSSVNQTANCWVISRNLLPYNW